MKYDMHLVDIVKELKDAFELFINLKDGKDWGNQLIMDEVREKLEIVDDWLGRY